MGITAELGWIDLFPHADDPKKFWLNEPVFPEDIEYVCSKAFATRASLAFLENFRRHKNLPLADSLSEILRKYSEYRRENIPTGKTEEFLIKDKNGAILRDGKLYSSRIHTATFEQGCSNTKIENKFERQTPEFRLQALRAADYYDHPSAVTLAEIDETKPIEEELHLRLDTPVAACGNHGLGVWCKGDGSGAIVTVALRNLALNSRKVSEHYIKADFVGWKYFAFYETQNAALESDYLPPKRLEYKNYNHLQEFYGFYRAKMDYESLDGIDITVKGSKSICLRSLRLVPDISPDILNPTVHFGDTSIKIMTRLTADTSLYFNGKECIVTDLSGKELTRPAFIGTPVISKGKNEIILERAENDTLSRAKLTVITRGEILQ